MSGRIKQMTDTTEQENLFPVTVEKAVYDDEGNRLDNKLNEINENVGQIDTDLTKAKSDITKINNDLSGLNSTLESCIIVRKFSSIGELVISTGGEFSSYGTISIPIENINGYTPLGILDIINGRITEVSFSSFKIEERYVYISVTARFPITFNAGDVSVKVLYVKDSLIG